MGIQVTMDFFQHRYYKINKILLTMIGQWPYQTTRSQRSFIAVGFFITTGHFVSEIMVTVRHHNDAELFLDCALPLIFGAICLTRAICCKLNSQKMLKLLNRIRTDWEVWAKDPEVNILHHYADQGRKMTIAYGVTICSNGILFLTQPIIPKIIDVLLNNGSKPVDFPILVEYYHLDLQKYYFYVIMYSCVCGCAAMLCAVAIDAMFIVHVQHGCGIFTALGHKLDRIEKNQRAAEIGETAYALDKSDMDFKHLISCIDRHNDAIEYAELIEATYSWCFFLSVGLNMLMITITGLQIVKTTNHPQKTIKFIFWLAANLIRFFTDSYMSQILMDHSISIRYYIHNSKWYNLSPKARKFVPLMLMRCDLPCKLTAGRIIIMSMETFGGFLKTSISYFTVLLSM